MTRDAHRRPLGAREDRGRLRATCAWPTSARPRPTKCATRCSPGRTQGVQGLYPRPAQQRRRPARCRRRHLEPVHPAGNDRLDDRPLRAIARRDRRPATPSIRCRSSSWSTNTPPAPRRSPPARSKTTKSATLVGTKTYGKGVVQSLYTLPDGGALKITTARYVTPPDATSSTRASFPMCSSINASTCRSSIHRKTHNSPPPRSTCAASPESTQDMKRLLPAIAAFALTAMTLHVPSATAAAAGCRSHESDELDASTLFARYDGLLSKGRCAGRARRRARRNHCVPEERTASQNRRSPQPARVGRRRQQRARLQREVTGGRRHVRRKIAATAP